MSMLSVTIDARWRGVIHGDWIKNRSTCGCTVNKKKKEKCSHVNEGEKMNDNNFLKIQTEIKQCRTSSDSTEVSDLMCDSAVSPDASPTLSSNFSPSSLRLQSARAFPLDGIRRRNERREQVLKVRYRQPPNNRRLYCARVGLTVFIVVPGSTYAFVAAVCVWPLYICIYMLCLFACGTCYARQRTLEQATPRFVSKVDHFFIFFSIKQSYGIQRKLMLKSNNNSNIWRGGGRGGRKSKSERRGASLCASSSARDGERPFPFPWCASCWIELSLQR